MLCDVLKDFWGSQDGRFTEQFKVGTRVDVSDHLYGIVKHLGVVKPCAKPHSHATTGQAD